MENEIQLVLKLRAVGNGLFTCKLALLLIIQHAFVKKKEGKSWIFKYVLSAVAIQTWDVTLVKSSNGT